MDNDWKFKPTGPLLILSKVLGEASPDWAAEEELDQLSCFINIDGRIASNIQLEHVLPLVQAYGDVLLCRFLVGEQIVLDVSQQTTQDEIDRFHNAISGVQQIVLDFRIDKSRLATNWFGDLFDACPFPNQLFLYFYPARQEQFIARSIPSQLEERLWKDHRYERIVFLIPERETCIVGPYILVIGGKHINQPPESIFHNLKKDNGELTRVYRECQEALKWQKPWIDYLTPWHLYAEPITSNSDLIVDFLRLHFINLFLLYTADRTTEKDKQQEEKVLISSYTNSQQVLDVGFQEGQHDISTIPSDNFKALLQIFEWAYDAHWKANDRLPIVQIGIVEAIKGTVFPLRYKLLLENAPIIAENINWHWKAFVEGKIDAYLDQVQSLEEYIGKTVNSYLEQISSIINSLTETMLAAVGVVLGSFIAALFQEKFNPVVFRIGLLTYALYVIFFPLLYNMRHRWETVVTLEKEFDVQKGWFEKRLPPDRVNSIVEQSQITQNKERFKRWFWWTVAIYLLVFVLLLVAAFTIPGLINIPADQSNTSTPIMTLTVSTQTVIPNTPTNIPNTATLMVTSTVSEPTMIPFTSTP